jgi:hypothetical protein
MPGCDVLDPGREARLVQVVGSTRSSLASWRISAAGYWRWPPRVFRNGSLPSLAQRDTVLGDTDSRSATSAARRYRGRSGAVLLLGWAATAHPFHPADPLAMPGPNASRCSSGPTATMLAAATLLGRRTNRTIMQIGPTARHSPIGLFQRVCYLVHVVGDSWVAAARRTQPPAPRPARRRARPGGNRGHSRPMRGRSVSRRP